MQGKLSRAARMLLGFTALMGAVNSAVAAGNTITIAGKSVWTVYAFGNAQAVADAFRALSNFAASGAFQSIVSMVAVLGVLGVGASGGFNPSQARKLIGYFVGVFLTCYFLFGVGNGGPLVVNLEVIDSVDMTWKAPVTVPAVVGIPASIISTVGYRMTAAIEASFALPAELKMSNGAPFNLAAAMIADASQARITDPDLAASLSYYVQDCFTIGVARGNLAAESLIHSTDFLNSIRFDSPSVMVNTLLQPPVGEPGVVSCGEAWTLINNAVSAQGTGAASFLSNASAWARTPALSVVNAAADKTAQWASNNGVTDGGAMVKQAAVLASFRGAYSQAATQTGNSEFLTGLAMAQATESQRSSWITGAEVFNKSMGYIFAVLQVFVYAITPLILCAALVPGLGLALLKNFLQILLWLAIWQPMLAIVNFIVISMQQAELGGILTNGSTFGFTMGNIGIVTEKSANLRAAATFVGTMVPALAWAMVKGSMDFSRVIGSAVGENFAQGAANTMTTGNYSLNQASMDSFTANKHSTASTSAWGGGKTNADGTASSENNLGGSQLAQASGERSALQVGSNQGTTTGSTGGTSGVVGENTGNSTAVANAKAKATQAAAGTTSAEVDTSGTNSSLGASAAANARVSVLKPGGGGSSGGGADGPGNGQDGDGKKAGAAATLRSGAAALADRLSADVTGGVNAATGANQTHANNHQESRTLNTTGSNTDSTTDSRTAGSTAATSATAGQTHGEQSGTSQNFTGISSAFDRAQALGALTRTDNQMTRGAWGLGTAVSSSDLGDKAVKMGQTGGVAADVQAERKQNAADEKKYGDEVDAGKAKVDKKADQTAAQVANVITKVGGEAKAGEAAAKVKPSERVGNAMLEQAGDMVKSAGGTVDKIKESVGNFVTGMDKRPEGGNDAAGPKAVEPPAVVARPDAGPSAQKDARLASAMGGMMGGGGGFTPTGNRLDQPGQPSGQQVADQRQAPGDKPGQPAGQQVADQRHAPGDKPGQPAGAQAPGQRHAGEKPGQPTGQQVADQRHAPGEKPGQPAGSQVADQRHAPGDKPGQPGQAAGQPNAQQLASRQDRQPQGRNDDGAHPGRNEVNGERHARNDAPGKAGHENGQHLASQSGNQPDRGQQKPDERNPQGPGAQKPEERNQLAQGAPKPNERGTQPPGAQQNEERNQLAQGGDQQQRERELQDRQERQLAATSAVGQALQQMNPQPMPATAPLPAMDQSAQLAAAHQHQQQQQLMPGQNGTAAPNPFSGEKAGESEGQLQGQVMMAEQRAERMGNQLRGVDGMLASAESRSPGELPELITQAREMVRNA